MATALENGIQARFIDEQVEDDVLPLVDRHVQKMEKPYIFGFSVLTAAFKRAILLSQELKRRYPESIIVFGGVHPTAMPEEILSYGHVDCVIRGEGDKTLMQFYECVKQGKDVSHIDNLSYRKNGEVIHNHRRFIYDDIEALPPFPYHLFDPKKYDLGFVLSSRGCPYRCIFCSNRITTGRRYRYRSAQAIVREIELLHQQYDKHSILFLDDNFLVSKERIYDLIGEIKKKGIDRKVSFNFQARGDNVDEKLLRDMYDAGFRSIFFGMETASEEIMKVIKKDETVAECVAAVKMAKDIGYHVSATFIYGLPGDSHENRMECVRMSRDLKIDMVRYNNATPYPGTALYDMAKAENRLYIQGMYENFNSVSTFIENPFKQIPFSYVPQGNTETEIRRDLLFSYFSFYLDISKLRNIFTKPDQGVGWFRAGEKLFEIIKNIPALMLLGLMMFFKFGLLFHYMVLKRETSLSFREFLKVFDGLRRYKVKDEKTVS